MIEPVAWDDELELELDLPLDAPILDADHPTVRAAVADKLTVAPEGLPPLEVRRRAIDARHRRVRFHLTVGARPVEPRRRRRHRAARGHDRVELGQHRRGRQRHGRRAAQPDDPELAARQLLHDLWRATTQLFGRDPPPPTPGSFRYGGLLDTSGLERFVIKIIPWTGIERNIKSGALHALSVSATHIATGHTVVFVSAAGPVPTGWSKDPFVRHQAARIGPRHVLASAAIPLLFPSVKVGDSFYTDGGLRQNTPMSPAIRLGADKMLMVSLRHVDEVAPRQPTVPDGFPRPLFLVGKALNALMLDHTDYDLDRMKRVNAILEAGTAAFGPGFVDVMNANLVKLRGAPIRPIAAMHIRPSADIGVLASDFVKSGKLPVSSPVTRRLIERMAAGESGRENDFLSYLLFDGNWASELIELGHRDAAARGRGAGAVLHGVITGGPT